MSRDPYNTQHLGFATLYQNEYGEVVLVPHADAQEIVMDRHEVTRLRNVLTEMLEEDS